jgi:tetratricopeptide (TPR) repeat protein
MARWIFLLCLISVAGCKSGTLPDPNDPKDAEVSPEIVRKNLQSISDSLIERRLKKEIDNLQYRELLAKAATELSKEFDLQSVDPSEAWQYAEVLRAARNWEAAKPMLEIAVKHAKLAKNEDRRINDTLRLAEVLAQLGQVQESIATAKQVLDARPTDSAPILMGVFYEIAPVARGRDHDRELAELLEGAIRKHLATQVDAETEAGRNFIAARSHHVTAAYALLSELYTALNEPEKSQEAIAKAQKAVVDIDALTNAVGSKGGGRHRRTHKCCVRRFSRVVKASIGRPITFVMLPSTDSTKLFAPPWMA